MLTRFGQSLTLTHKTIGAYDPATGAAAETTSTQTGVGVVSGWGQGFIDGSLIKSSDKQLLLSATDITAPALGDTVTVGNVVYTLVEPLNTVSPGATVVLYQCNLRA